MLCGRDFGLNLGENLGKNLNFGENLGKNLNKKLNSLINLDENSNANLDENLQTKKRTACVIDCCDFATQNLAMTNSSANSTKNLNPNLKPNLNKKLNINLIAAKLFTGRTHQIRAHLESLNRHILGDTLYGYKGKSHARVMLHAYLLYFRHPKTGEEMLVKAPLFEDFKQILNHFDREELDEKLSPSYIKRLFSAVS